MLNEFSMRNFGIHRELQWSTLGKINVILGENGTGKTHILKALYSAVKVLERYQKGNENRGVAELLADKLYWTFQVDRLGDLVSKSAKKSLQFSLSMDKHMLSYEFGTDTNQKITKVKTTSDTAWDTTSIFVPAKEILSLWQVILKSRDQDQIFGFDDTYLDLVRALQIPTRKGNNYGAFAKSRETLEQILKGNIVYDEVRGLWYFKRGNVKFPIGLVSEGIKKLSIFHQLLANRYLMPESILFIDEPEASLHPKAVSRFMEMLAVLASSGMQIFLATHSYFVIKKLCLLARSKNIPMPVLSLRLDGLPETADMKDGMPDNSILDESVQLYEAEVDLALGEG